MELALILLIVLVAVSAILYGGWFPQKAKKAEPTPAQVTPPAEPPSGA